MIETLIFALLAGLALGMIFFFGLWWTVRKGLSADNPAAWFLGCFLLRLLMAVTGFYWIAQFGQWQHLLVALFGFIASRVALSRWVSHRSNGSNKEKNHAS